MTLKTHIVVFLAACTLSACAINTPAPDPTASLLGPRAKDPDKSGLALAGGGTKAASYSMGVLAALASSPDQDLEKLTAISSVSGGGYAALFLYTKLMVGENDPLLKPRDYFADCFPSAYKGLLPAATASGQLPVVCDDTPSKNDAFRFQQFVRCRQDVLEHDCRPDFGKRDDNYVPGTVALLGVTLGASIPNFAARTVFDWPVNMSPSRSLYRQGIGTTYGLFPLTADAAGERADIVQVCDKVHFKNCESDDTSAHMVIDGMDFDALRGFLERQQGRYPVWLVNATSSKKRSLLGWATKGQRNFQKYTLQMSPYGARSGLYGNVDLKENKLDLLNSVTAAASFFDANETAVAQPWRLGLAATQHVLTTDWGMDIPNPNIGDGWRYLHAAMPFPFYYLDGSIRYLHGAKTDATRSAYIRLLDGGNNDGFGAFSLIEAGMQKIFIADNLSDSDGRLQDLCYLHNEINFRKTAFADGKERHLIMPGIEGLKAHCAQFASESESEIPGATRADAPVVKGGYPILAWTHKVVLGCIRPGDYADCKEHADSKLDARIFFLKPALDLNAMRTKYINRTTMKLEPDACTKTEPGLCEVAAFVLDWYQRKGKDMNEDIGPFPQDSTPMMTLASDPKRYGAYRGLGQWQMTQALADSKLSTEAFAEHVDEQAGHPIRFKPKL